MTTGKLDDVSVTTPKITPDAVTPSRISFIDDALEVIGGEILLANTDWKKAGITEQSPSPVT